MKTKALATAWYRFSRHGIKADQSMEERRQRFLLNLFWFIAFLAYQIYFVAVVSVVQSHQQQLVVSALSLLSGFGIIQVLVHYGLHRLAKMLLLVSIYIGIFFYDTFLGHEAGVHLYYIPFLFVTIYLFSYKTEKVELLLFSLLPVALYAFTETVGHKLFTSPLQTNFDLQLLYTGNLVLSLVLVGVYNFATSRIIYEHEARLDQSKINLQTLIDNTQGSIWSIGADYRIIAANNVYKTDMKAIFGVELHTGYSMRSVVASPAYPKQWIQHYARVFGGERFVEEYLFDGRSFELHAAPIYNRKNEVVGAAFHARDITGRKKRERELKLAKEKAEAASVAKAQFLSNMSHELRTPLNGVIGLSNILLSETYLPAQRPFLETLQSSADHMKHLVDDILDYSKIDAGKLELENSPFNLAHLLKKTHFLFSTQAADKNLKFRLEAGPELQRNILGDVTRLQQVLNNLLSNAIKFTHKGEVVLAVRILERLGEAECLLEYSVTDTGIGIPAEKLALVFESFTQADVKTNRKYGGTGLGLTISKKLVTLMGGELCVDSHPDKGSRFSFALRTRCSEKEEQVAVPRTIQSFQPLPGLRVLLAEDNHVNMKIAVTMLRKWNVEVSTAVNGALAVEQARAGEHDLILMDLEMPVMDGWQAVNEIRRFNMDVPVLAFTAASYEGLEAELAEKGINGFVRKPFTPPELYGKISAYIPSVN